MFAGYELHPKDIHDDKRVLTYHRYIEACKFANGLKQFIKDLKFYSKKVCRLTAWRFLSLISEVAEKHSDIQM